jgi:hypothetical protein
MKTLSVLACLLLINAAPMQGAQPLANFSHLRHLTETIAMDGDSVDIVHIYANYPNYEWVDAKESGPEGIACVDDAARAAVVLLRHYELTKNAESLRRAKRLLGFVMKMQADDGQFYNFIFADHSINRNGKTSYKSFGWWASRAVWSLSSACRILKTTDVNFADRCRRSVSRALPWIDSVLVRYGRTRTIGDYRIPTWLLYESGADVSSELLLGLIEYARAYHDARIERTIGRLADGLIVMQNGGWDRYPYGLHRSWETQWHAWGNGQTQALASAAAQLAMPALLGSARLEADCFYSRLLAEGMMKELDAAVPEKKIVYEQIAYGIRPMAVGLMRLYEATHSEVYLKMAGLSASWFFGNNTLGLPIYDAVSGRCFDGIRDSATVNRNSGAESTIEALAVMTEIDRYPAIGKYLRFTRTSTQHTAGNVIGVFRNPEGDELALVIDTAGKTVKLLEGAAAGKYIHSY